jgi:hypothetical protein
LIDREKLLLMRNHGREAEQRRILGNDESDEEHGEAVKGTA